MYQTQTQTVTVKNLNAMHTYLLYDLFAKIKNTTGLAAL
jgi:hypothetical protein